MENRNSFGIIRGRSPWRRLGVAAAGWALAVVLTPASQAAALPPGTETISPNPVIAVIEQNLQPLAQSRRVALTSERFAGPVAVQPGLQLHPGDRLASSGGVRLLLRCADGALINLSGSFDVSMTGSCAFNVQRGHVVGESSAGPVVLGAEGASLHLERGVASVLVSGSGQPGWRVLTGSATLLGNDGVLTVSGGRKVVRDAAGKLNTGALEDVDKARVANILARLKTVASSGAADYQEAVDHYAVLRDEYLRTFGETRALVDGQRVNDQELELGAVADVDNLLAVHPGDSALEASVATRREAWELPGQGALIGSTIATQVTPPETPQGFIPPSGIVRDF